MKTVLFFVASLASASIALPAAAQTQLIDSYTHATLVQVCTNAAKDDHLGLHKTLREYRLSPKKAVQKVVCNGSSLMDFAKENQALKVTAMLKPYADHNPSKVTVYDVVAAAAN